MTDIPIHTAGPVPETPHCNVARLVPDRDQIFTYPPNPVLPPPTFNDGCAAELRNSAMLSALIRKSAG